MTDQEEWLKGKLRPVLEEEIRMATEDYRMGQIPIEDQARIIVVDHFNGTRDPSDTDRYQLKLEDVYVVWFCKTLQNWKALVSTILPDLTYYEVTYNGNENVAYLDVYTKTMNREISLAVPVLEVPSYRTPYD